MIKLTGKTVIKLLPLSSEIFTIKDQMRKDRFIQSNEYFVNDILIKVFEDFGWGELISSWSEQFIGFWQDYSITKKPVFGFPDSLPDYPRYPVPFVRDQIRKRQAIDICLAFTIEMISKNNKVPQLKIYQDCMLYFLEKYAPNYYDFVLNSLKNKCTSDVK